MLTVETPERHRFDHPSDAIFDFEFQIHVTGKRYTKKKIIRMGQKFLGNSINLGIFTLKFDRCVFLPIIKRRSSDSLSGLLVKM